MATIRKKVCVVNPDGTKTDLNNTPIRAFKGARAGCIMHNGFEIPYTVKVYQDKNGESFYVSGIRKDDSKSYMVLSDYGSRKENNQYYIMIKYFEREDNKYVEYPYNKIASYLEWV